MSAVADRRRYKPKVTKVKYRRPWVYEKQAAFLFTPCRYSFVEATTKSGKTVGCIVWLNEKAVLEGHDGWNGWWVAPVFGQAKIAWTRLKKFTRKLGALAPKFNETELSAVYPNGAKLWFKSAEKPDNLYGEDVYAAVLDEASRMREQSWHAVRSTLTATQGPIRIIGNVKGRKNWFYKLARKAQAGEPDCYFDKLTAWDAVEAGILAKKEIEDARRMLPEAVFNELYLAIPTEDGSNPFGLDKIKACMMPRLADGPVKAHGIDLAKSIDWCVDVGLNAKKQQAYFDRWQGPWDATKKRIRAAVGSTRALVDSTGVGDPIVEDLQKGSSNFTGFKYSQSSKQQLMEGLALFIQERAAAGEPCLWAGPGDVMLNELESFEYVVRLNNGRVTGVSYAAPEGMHDDCVHGLALAVEQSRSLSNMSSGKGSVVPL